MVTIPLFLSWKLYDVIVRASVSVSSLLEKTLPVSSCLHEGTFSRWMESIVKQCLFVNLETQDYN